MQKTVELFVMVDTMLPTTLSLNYRPRRRNRCTYRVSFWGNEYGSFDPHGFHHCSWYNLLNWFGARLLPCGCFLHCSRTKGAGTIHWNEDSLVHRCWSREAQVVFFAVRIKEEESRLGKVRAWPSDLIFDLMNKLWEYWDMNTHGISLTPEIDLCVSSCWCSNILFILLTATWLLGSLCR